MKNKIPQDLGIKIGTPLEALWTKVKKESELEIKVLEESLIIQKAILQLAEDKILLELERKLK